MKRVAVLGSTGSVGENALRVIEAASDRFEIVGLAAGAKVERLREQALAHRPLLASVASEEAAAVLTGGLQGSGTEVLAGEAANLIARKNAELKDLRSRDEGRLDADSLAFRKIEGRWYNRLGAFLVDETFGEETEVVVVRFASDAYFELVQERPDLRKALAASRLILVMADPEHAVLVSDRVGVEQFSDEARKQIGLTVR